LTATSGANQIALSWGASTGATQYQIYRGTGRSDSEANTPIHTTTGTTYTDTGLNNGTTYYYNVSATNSVGISPDCDEITAVPGGTNNPPPTPTGVAASPGNAMISVSWSSSNGATSYNIYRSTASGAEGTTAIATTTGLSFDNTGLSNGTKYYYKVSATNSVGTSGQSAEVSSTPAAGGPPPTPMNVSAAAGDSQVTVSYNASSGATSYNIFRSTTSGGEGTTAIATTANTSFTNTGLANGTTYFYKVSASNANGSSAQSSEVSATPAASGNSTAIDCGGVGAGSFVADTDFTGGTTLNHANTIDTTGVTNPAPVEVYQTARVGTFSYTIPGFVAGSSHTVRLHFCETYFSTTGSRTFNVSINGTQVLTNFDILVASGAKNKANVQQFTENANSSGQYVIAFTSVVNQSLVSGIEIL